MNQFCKGDKHNQDRNYCANVKKCFNIKDFLKFPHSVTRMHGLAVYVKEGRPYAQDLSLENSAGS